MKILFICGCLEPGKDGVGDYTRRLGGELTKQGHDISIVALNDHYISGVNEVEQVCEGKKVWVLRLGKEITHKERYKRTRDWTNQFDPEWLSLQYVVFSFQRKGLPWRLGFQLAKIGAERKWHVMFHELWAGMDHAAPWKFVLLSNLQKLIIKHLLFSLSPRCINTQTPLYQIYLNKMGYEASLLSLFGNIETEAKNENLSRDSINVAVFGGIHYGAKLENFIGWLQRNNNYTYKFHLIGSNGAEQQTWIKTLEEYKVDYHVYGWMSNMEVSRALSRCQWSVTSTPYYLVEKSGAVAVMLEHNLNVICIARDWFPRGVDTTKLERKEFITKWSEDLDFIQFNSFRKHSSGPGLQKVAKDFVYQLSKNKSYGSTEVSLEQQGEI